QPPPSPKPTSQPTPQAGVTVPPDDPAIEVAGVSFPAEDGASVMAYLSRPRGAGPFPAVMVCHENRGLVEHIKDITRRLAKASYVSLAPDLLSREGGTDRLDAAQVPGILGNAPPTRFVQDFQAAFNYLQAQPFVRRDRIGMVGFCFGGGVTWRVATKLPGLRAAVVFYGPNPPLEDVPGIQAPVLAIYAERDNFVNPGIPAIENAMRQHNKVFERVVYPNTEHAFHNDTGARYNAEAARDAWARTLAWFERYLKA
ncbi:MAG: dienelactone hydrolase family protein, partial [Chloroflexota bacterium]